MEFKRFRRNGEGIEVDLPKVFLKLPKMKSIHKLPGNPYGHDTEGVIHSSKITEMLKILVSQKERLVELRDILEGHQLAGKIATLTIDELAEFVIHTLMANRENLGWDIVDRLENQLSLRYIPRWVLPSLDFSDQLRSIFSTIIQNKVSDEIITELKTIGLSLDQLNKPHVDFGDFNQSIEDLEKNISTIRSIFTIYANIRYLIQKKGLLHIEFKKSLQFLETVLLDFIHSDRLNDPEHKILLFSLFIRFYISDNPQKIETCQFIYDKMENNMAKLTEHKKLSFSWILNAVRSRISYHINEYSTDMISEDILINSLTNTFLNPDGVDLEKWSRIIVNPDINPWVFTVLLDGYIAISAILRQYYSGVTDPPKIPKFNKLNDFIYNSTRRYLINRVLNETDEDVNISKFDTVFRMLQFPHVLKEEFIEVLIDAMTNKILFDDHAKIQNISYIKTLENLNEISVFTQTNQIKLMNLKMIAGTMNLDELFKKISKEVNETGSFITSTTFENRVITPYAELFSKAKQIEENLDEVPKGLYEELTFFLAEWLRKLLKLDYMESELIIILLPFIKISLLMIEKFYEYHNQITKAQLIKINAFLLELFLGIRYNFPDFRQIKGLKDRNQLVEDFFGVLKNFNLESQFDMSSVRIFSFMVPTNISKITQQNRTDMFQSKKFDDDKIISYMVMSDDLDQFLSFLENSSIEEIKKGIPEYANKFAQSTRNFDFLSKIGILGDEYDMDTLIFPYFKNIEALSIALDLFPIKLELERFDLSTSTQ